MSLDYGVLLPYQKKWISDISPVKVAEKGRQIGFTWTEACDVVLYAASDIGSDVWYIGYNKELAQEFIGHCAGWAKHFNRIVSEIQESELVDEDKKILTFSITFASGNRISALSSRPSTLRGKGGKVVIDEAAFHDDLGELLKAAMAFLIWGGRVVIISTHNGDDNPFNELIKDIRAGRYPYSLHRITFRDALSDGLYERIKMVLESKKITMTPKDQWINELYKRYGDSAAEELDCIPARGGVAYFTQSLVESCMYEHIKVIRFRSPAEDFVDWALSLREQYTNNWCKDNIAPLVNNNQDRAFIGADIARSGDLAVFWVFTESTSLVMDTLFVIELQNTPFSEQERIFDFIVGKLPFVGAAIDARGNGAQLAESKRQKYGANRILEVQTSEKWYLEVMPKSKARLEDKTVTLPRDAAILSDFRQVKLMQGIPKLPAQKTKIDGTQRHGDSVIAYAMAVYARDMLGDIGDNYYESLYKRNDLGNSKTAY